MPRIGYHHSEETKEKIRRANSGPNSYMYGRTGEKHPFYGKHHTDDANQKNRLAHLGRHYSRKPTDEELQQMRLRNLHENNPVWKGDYIAYSSLHDWLRGNYQKPKSCQKCGLVKKLDFANITGIYNRDISNWAFWCRRCHKKFDLAKRRKNKNAML